MEKLDVILAFLFVVGIVMEVAVFYNDVKNGTKVVIKATPIICGASLLSLIIREDYYALAFGSGVVIGFLGIPLVCGIFALIQFVWGKITNKK